MVHVGMGRVLLALAVLASVVAAFPLQDYVNKDDGHYKWEDTGVVVTNGTGWSGYLLNLTSQQWMDPSLVSISVWTHQLLVIVPDSVRHTDIAAIYVTGGGNDNPGIPSPTDEDVIVSAALSVLTGTVTATLWQVPNQPIVFADDPTQKKRGEDALVAFSWVEYMNNQDKPEWVSLFPMVKSVVKAMDAVADYAANVRKVAQINRFLIAGASKRGWTTWLTGAVDTRVAGIVPIVMDMLNFNDNLKHMFRSYGGWTFAFADYWDLNLTSMIDTPQMAALAKLIDPLNYVDQLTMPKLVVDSPGDEFFMPDDDQFWWGKLKGETYRLMVSNAEHSMATGVVELMVGADAFYESIIRNLTRPSMDWSIDNTTGQITMITPNKPTEVVIWTATTFDTVRRDFRLVKGDTPTDPCQFIKVKIFGHACINPVIWVPISIGPSAYIGGNYVYETSIPLPPEGYWRGIMVEANFPGAGIFGYRFTTQISIIPNTFPFPACDTVPGGCHGTLV